MNRKDILIVEDDSGSRKALAALLREEGYEVREAGDGSSAVDIISEAPPGLVIADYQLPDLTAVSLIERSRGCPIIVVSGAVKYESGRGLAGQFQDPGEEVLRAGAAAYLAKPVDTPRLLETIENVLG